MQYMRKVVSALPVATLIALLTVIAVTFTNSTDTDGGEVASENKVASVMHAGPYDPSIRRVSVYEEGKPPTGEEMMNAKKLIEETYENAQEKGWFDYDTARSAGFAWIKNNVHHPNLEYLADDHILDPTRPESLIFYSTPEGQRLYGAMFFTRSHNETGPQIGGPLTEWHYHVWDRELCLIEGIYPVEETYAPGKCRVGIATNTSPQMLHVWFIDHPEGPFSDTMGLSTKLVRYFANDPRFIQK